VIFKFNLARFAFFSSPFQGHDIFVPLESNGDYLKSGYLILLVSVFLPLGVPMNQHVNWSNYFSQASGVTFNLTSSQLSHAVSGILIPVCLKMYSLVPPPEIKYSLAEVLE